MQNEYISFFFLEGQIEHKRKLAQIIRAVRGLFGYSQEEMAKIAGSSRPTLSKLERMEEIEKIRHETFEKFLRAFADMGVIVRYYDDGGVQVEMTPQALDIAVQNSLDAWAAKEKKAADKKKK
ncbi:MAG: helix-turn-helix transcriptional regulator [Desulfuromonadaceae bacterium]|nr:helix-turn-helix transcriptional regulator [Desulfuromonadaceae bacterium]